MMDMQVNGDVMLPVTEFKQDMSVKEVIVLLKQHVSSQESVIVLIVFLYVVMASFKEKKYVIQELT